jgi:hypothetical protein
MTCGSCGATIADKAIVCYRCGAPTASPAMPAGGVPARRSRTASVVLLAIGVVLLAVSVMLPDENWIVREVTRLSGLALVVLMLFRLITRRR